MSYINFKDKLFLPEGDDYSKGEFDKENEEMRLKADAVLQQMRAQQAQTAVPPIPSKVQPKKETTVKENARLSYKEIFEKVFKSK